MSRALKVSQAILRGKSPKAKAKAKTKITARKPKVVTPTLPLVGKVTVTLPCDILEQLQKTATKRGTDISTLVRVSLHCLARRSRYYDLKTKMGFGKYAVETIETVIRCDPGYIVWAMREMENFEVSAAVVELLDEVEGK